MKRWKRKLRILRGFATLLALVGLIVLIGVSVVYANGSVTSYNPECGELSADGKITFELPARYEDTQLLVLMEDSGDIASWQVPLEASKQEYVMQLTSEHVYGGEEIDFYAVLLEEGDLKDFSYDEANLDHSQDDSWVYTWADSEGNNLEFSLTKFSRTRAVERSLHVYKDTSNIVSKYGVSDGDIFFDKYKVGENDEDLIFEVTTNEEDLGIVSIKFEGDQFVTPVLDDTNTQDTQSGDKLTVYKYTAPLIDSISEGEISFTLYTTKGDTITQADSNNGADEGKVSFVAGGKTKSLKIEALSTLVGPDDSVRFTFGADYRFKDISLNGNALTSGYTVYDINGCVLVVLSTDNCTHYKFITATVTAVDDAGNEVVFELNEEDSFTFFNPAEVIGESSLGIEVNNEWFVSSDGYYIQNGDTLTFSLILAHTKDNLAYSEDSIKLYIRSAGSTEYYECQMSLIRSNENAREFTGTISIADAASEKGWSETGSPLEIRIEGTKNIDLDSDSTSTEIIAIESENQLGGGGLYYLEDFAITGLQAGIDSSLKELPADYTAPLPEFIIVDGDKVAIAIDLKHAISVNENFELKVGGNLAKPLDSSIPASQRRGAYYKLAEDGKTITITLYMPHSGQADYYNDGVRLNVQKSGSNEAYINISLKTDRVRGRSVEVGTENWPGKKDQLDGRVFHILKYWVPVTIEVGLDYDKYNDDDLDTSSLYGIVKDGSVINFKFTANRDIRINEIVTTLSAKKNGQNGSGSASAGCTYTQNGNEYSASMTVGSGNLSNIADQSVMRLGLEVTDKRGQKISFKAGSDGDNIEWPIYYAPLQVSGVKITSSNTNDGDKYGKDGDTVTVEFNTNHYVMMDASIIGKNISVENRRSRTQTSYSFSYTLENGDLKDLEEIGFAFQTKDLAGDSIGYTNMSSGVTNHLKYYAPLEVTAGIKSSNPNPVYAKNGDTITITSTANHETQPHDFSIGSRTIGSKEEFAVSHAMSYRIPGNENELYEGDVFFSVRLEDPAGNYKMVSAANDNGDNSSKVIYDRTAPEIKIAPGFNGYTNQDVGFFFIYSDMYLDMSTVSCVLNGTEEIKDKAGAETLFEHQVELTSEGEYIVSATAVDMAGNEVEFSAVCHLIIDKTKPVIHMELARNTFKAGLTLDSITSIEEDNLSSLVCTITDSKVAEDWSLDQPIENDGKKTVYIMACDMADNVSTPITYDIYIDGKVPQPHIVCDQEEFQMEGKNIAVGSQNTIDINLSPMHIGDEKPDSFTTLKLVDSEGITVIDFLGNPDEEDTYTCKLKEYDTYTLLMSAQDDVGNDTGSLMYLIEYREQYLLERLLENTPIAGFAKHINDTMLLAICIVLVLLAAGITTLIVLRRRKKKKLLAQEYVIIDKKE